MKKVYAIFSGLFIAGTAICQNFNVQPLMKKHITSAPEAQAKGISSTPTAKAIIWSEDFANGIPAGWSNNGTPTAAMWEYRGPATTPNTSVGGQGGCSGGDPIQSPSVANGFVIFDSNYLDDPGGTCAGALGSGVAPSPHTGILQTDAIDLSANTAVLLSFYRYARNFAASMTVNVSVDGGTTWTEVWASTLAANAASPFDEQIKVNISAVAGGQSDVRLQFDFDGDYYEWAVDDIVIEEPPANDMDIIDANVDGVWAAFELEYTESPLAQASANPLNFEGAIQNAGANNQTNTTFDVTVTRGGNTVFTGSSAPITLNSGVQDTLMTSTTYTPDTTGTYDFTFSGSADSATTNSQITKQLTVGDSVYSRDTDNWAGGFFMIAETCGGSEIGHAFDIYADQEATSISAFIVAAASVPGAIVQGKIYQSDLATVVAETDFYALDAADLGTLLTIPLLTPTTLLASDTTYIAVIGSFQSASDTVAIGSSGTVPPQTSFLLDVDDCNGQGAGTWFFVTGAPMVRLNFSKCAGFSVSTVKTDEDSTGASNGTATATATGGASPFTYVWNDANNQTTATATGLVSGPYIVTVTDGIGCVATSSIQIWITGIDDKNPLTSMAIYPNPNKGQFYIEFKNTVDDYFINAINVLGQTVYSKEIAVNGSYIKQIDLTHLEAGTYFITVSNADGERRTERIVIE